MVERALAVNSICSELTYAHISQATAYLVTKPLISMLGNIVIHVPKDIESSRVFKSVAALSAYIPP